MLWQLASFPSCRHHVFLSHCGEDRGGLVWPVAERLLAGGIVPWLDRDNFAYGRDSRTALRDALIQCRHVIFFVTDSMLDVSRGWCVLELAYAEVIQSNLTTPGGVYANVALPLFLVPQDDPRLPASVWQTPRDRGRFLRTGTADPVDWCVQEIVAFLRREQMLADDWSKLARKHAEIRTRLDNLPPGLKQRACRFHPRRLPRL